MRLLRTRVLTITVGAAAAAFAASGCGAGDAADSAKSAVDPVAQAAETTQAQHGGTAITISGSVDVAGKQAPISGSGVFDHQAKLSQMTVKVDAAGKSVAVDEIMKDNVIYMSSDAFKDQLPGGKTWMKIDLRKALSEQGFDLDALNGGGASGDPAQTLDYLKGAGASKKVGTERVNGVDTTHYHVVIDLRKALTKAADANAKDNVDKFIKQAGTSTLPVDVWVDAKDLVRRETLAYAMNVQGQKGSTRMTMDMTKFGVELDAKTPPADDTYDVTGLAGKAAGTNG